MKRAPKRNLMLRMDAKLIDDLDRYCKNLNMSKSAFIQNMIKSVLEDAKTLFKGENLTFNDLYQLLASTAQKLVDFEREQIELQKAKQEQGDKMEASDKEAKGYSLLPGIDSLYFFISCETELYHNFYKLVDSGDYQKFENYSFQYKIPRIIVLLLQKIEK